MLVNCTPHSISVVHGDETTEYAPSGIIARATELRVSCGTLLGVPVDRVTYGDVINLPDSVPGTWYIVSALVRLALPTRVDLVSPGTLLRDSNGVVIGCASFICT